MNVALWIAQVLLAALFLFAGVMKLVVSIESMQGPMPMPGMFLRFIGVCETLGGLGLLLPGLLGIATWLTPLAAVGLVIIMIGATAVTIAGGDLVTSLIPAVVGVAAAFVAYGRWRRVPHRARASR